jgi:hypothetical protein
MSGVSDVKITTARGEKRRLREGRLMLKHVFFGKFISMNVVSSDNG